MTQFAVKEMFLTLQGEGAQAGRAAVFCRFTGCNLWNGLEADRASAICQFCDTDFVGMVGENGGRFASEQALAEKIVSLWPKEANGLPYVVFTGGEPCLQLNSQLCDALHAHGFEIAVETNGTIEVPQGVDWICVSPKFGAPLVQKSGDEIKVVVPQKGQEITQFEGLDFTHFFVQAMDGPEKDAAMNHAVSLCLARPKWRLSVQTHKVIGIA